MSTFEVFYVSSGRREVLSDRAAVRKFGRREWKEIKSGSLPHIVVVETASPAVSDVALKS